MLVENCLGWGYNPKTLFLICHCMHGQCGALVSLMCKTEHASKHVANYTFVNKTHRCDGGRLCTITVLMTYQVSIETTGPFSSHSKHVRCAFPSYCSFHSRMHSIFYSNLWFFTEHKSTHSRQRHACTYILVHVQLSTKVMLLLKQQKVALHCKVFRGRLPLLWFKCSSPHAYPQPSTMG